MTCHRICSSCASVDMAISGRKASTGYTNKASFHSEATGPTAACSTTQIPLQSLPPLLLSATATIIPTTTTTILAGAITTTLCFRLGLAHEGALQSRFAQGDFDTHDWIQLCRYIPSWLSLLHILNKIQDSGLSAKLAPLLSEINLLVADILTQYNCRVPTINHIGKYDICRKT